MEFVDGTVLRNFMPLAWQSALPVVLQVLEALDYAHRRGVLHRDIKPENIVIDREGAVKVMDFGIAHALGAARLTRERVVIGTLEYMPPERILNREMDRRSDVYSVGALLFEMLCGRFALRERQRIRSAARPGGGRSAAGRSVRRRRAGIRGGGHSEGAGEGSAEPLSFLRRHGRGLAGGLGGRRLAAFNRWPRRSTRGRARAGAGRGRRRSNRGAGASTL